jgi:hypothetical protein
VKFSDGKAKDEFEEDRFNIVLRVMKVWLLIAIGTVYLLLAARC